MRQEKGVRRVKTGEPAEKPAFGKDARTVGGLERGQRRRMMADERMIKDQGDGIKTGDASFI